MAIPKLDIPTYTIKLPSTGREILIRPFKVSEEKLLLIAAQSQDQNEIINTTKQVVRNCVLSERLDTEKLPFFDIDYIFIALRAKSIGDSIDVKFTCNNIVADHTCGQVFSAKIDIANVEMVQRKEVSKDINLGSCKVKMKYPTYAVMKTLNPDDITLEKKIKIIAASLDQIIQKDKVYTSKDFTPNEAKSFIEDLTQEQFKKLEDFIDNFPSFQVYANAICPKCGYNHNIKYDDFESFFL